MAKPVPLASTFDAAEARSIVAGVGCRRGASADEIVELVEAALMDAGLDASALAAIVTLDRKGNEPGLLAAAAYFGVSLRTFTADELAQADTAPSVISRLVGVASVAEAAARRAGRLIVPKQKSAHATCALAVCDPDFNVARFGQAVPASTAAMAASRSLTSNAGP